jgi:hypothetical protein
MPPADTPTRALRERLRALMAKATPGALYVEEDDETCEWMVYAKADEFSVEWVANFGREEDAEHFVAAVNALPALLAEAPPEPAAGCGNVQYIVVTSRALCSGGPITIEHYAGAPHLTKRLAVREGFKMYGSDDFFIGVLRDGKLTHFEDIEGSGHLHGKDLSEVAGQIGYEPARIGP